MKTVISLIRTSAGCPSQWEERCDNGEYFYARYRHGELRAATGGSLDQALDNAFGLTLAATAPLYNAIHGGAHDGFMEDEVMKLALVDVISFAGSGIPEHRSPGGSSADTDDSEDYFEEVPLMEDMAEAVQRFLPVVAALEGALLEYEASDRPGVAHAYEQGKRVLARYYRESGYHDASPLG